MHLVSHLKSWYFANIHKKGSEPPIYLCFDPWLSI